MTIKEHIKKLEAEGFTVIFEITKCLCGRLQYSCIILEGGNPRGSWKSFNKRHSLIKAEKWMRKVPVLSKRYDNSVLA